MPRPLPPVALRVSAGTIARLLIAVALLFAVTSAASLQAQPTDSPAPNPPALEIQRLLRQFREVGSVLYVAAHPDDENTEFITYFARGRGYRAAYLSLTRGDGGQNELGPDFSEKLGVLRTHELLAARHLDGGRQFFTRAVDFGFSKTPEETLRFWNHDAVLADVVRVIRQFQPDVIVTRFPIPPGSGGHGHHTASAILAVEAFKLAGDPHAYPEQLAQGLAPWQPKRILWNVFSWGRDNTGLTGPTVELDIGGHDPLTGEAFGTIANRSRGQHKTQGLGAIANRAATGPNVQTFRLLAGDPPEHALFDGVDLTWSRVPGGAPIAALAADLAAKFDPQNPAASVPAILAIRSKLLSASDTTRHGGGSAAPANAPTALLSDKLAQLDRLLQLCLGLTVENTVATAALVPGEEFKLHSTVSLSADFPVRWTGSRFPGSADGAKPVDLTASEPVVRDFTATIPADAPLSQPYWLREPAATGIYTVTDPHLIGAPENPPDFPIEHTFEIEGQTLVLSGQPVQPIANPDGTAADRPLAIISPAPIAWTHPLELLTPGSTHTVTLELTAERAGVSGSLELDCPAGWKITPARRNFTLAATGDRTPITFELTAPAASATADIGVRAIVDGRTYRQGRTELRYAHLPLQLLQPDTALKAVALNVDVRAKKIGYIPGAGDDVPECLRQLGCEVTELATADDLTPAHLLGFDAIVIGIRAFNENKNLAPAFPALLGYVETGGTIVAQYNRPSNALKGQPLGPYPLSIDGPAPQLRVTDETAPVTLLATDHPALFMPNKISSADFDAWVQERGAYFPSSWDRLHYTSLLSMSDPGEAPLLSSVLVAKHGRGYFVYTGLSFFRQLPAGVPGAYRLFANLVSLGK